MMSTNKYKYLGVLVDQTANLNEHFCSVFKKASDRLRLLKKIRHCLAMDAAQSVYKWWICTSQSTWFDEPRKISNLFTCEAVYGHEHL
jgi:hypothetical protein